MNIYSRRIQFKYLLFVVASIIGLSSLLYTNKLVEKLSSEERKKAELWAKAQNLVLTIEDSESLSFIVDVLQANETVPVIVVDENDSIKHFRNIDSVKINRPNYLSNKLSEMKANSDPIVIYLDENQKQYIYFDRSTILTKLKYYPYVQLTIIVLFIVVAYLAFSSSRKAEQNQVWVGLSKETAHQLGTPISSLMAWLDLLKLKVDDKELINELEKDTSRLEVITERFSKIGSKPKLSNENLIEVINETIQYLKTRVSKKIVFKIETPSTPIMLPLNVSLFEWVLENICKNSIDAIEGEGNITISVSEKTKNTIVDITDTGKGIARNKQSTIFKPGYTTKQRGWGLGLSLTKRIIEEYHRGKIYVAFSEQGKGTTIRILLNRHL